MTPRSLASEEALALKKEAFETLSTTNHWPHRPMLFEYTPPRRQGSSLEQVSKIGKPELSEIGYKLIGY
jgi:hypothetical protein